MVVIEDANANLQNVVNGRASGILVNEGQVLKDH